MGPSSFQSSQEVKTHKIQNPYVSLQLEMNTEEVTDRDGMVMRFSSFAGLSRPPVNKGIVDNLLAVSRTPNGDIEDVDTLTTYQMEEAAWKPEAANGEKNGLPCHVIINGASIVEEGRKGRQCRCQRAAQAACVKPFRTRCMPRKHGV